MHAELDQRLTAEARGPRSAPDIEAIWRRTRRQRRARQLYGSAAALAAAALVLTVSGGEPGSEVEFGGEGAEPTSAHQQSLATLPSTEHSSLVEVTPEAIVNLFHGVGAEDVHARLAQLGDDFVAVRGRVSLGGRSVGFHVYESPDADPTAHLEGVEGSVATRLGGHVVYELVGPTNEMETRSEQLLFACGAVVFNLHSMERPDDERRRLRTLGERILQETECRKG